MFEVLFLFGTNHPSIAYRAISCSKVEVEESVSRTGLFLCFENIVRGSSFPWVFILLKMLGCSPRECVLFLFSVFFVLLFVVFILLSVAFTTLFERHILRLSQIRLGPNKVRFSGILQAVLDGVKLVKKEQILPFNSSEIFFLVFPSVLFFVLFLDWLCLPFFFFFFNFQFSFFFLLCLVGFSVYRNLLRSIISKSKYSSVGGLRASSQRVSFEIALSLFFLCFFFFVCSLELSFLFCPLVFFLFFPYLFISLAELGRAPFDFSEGESELVRGYNTEYSSVAFALLFLGEYGVLLFFCFLGSVFFFFGSFFFVFFFFWLLLFFRSCFPRFRYDFLISFFWKILLPISLFFFLFFFIFFFFLFFFFFRFFIFFFCSVFCFFSGRKYIKKSFFFSFFYFCRGDWLQSYVGNE